MLSSVLNSRRAIAVNIEIMRIFVRMRGGLPATDELTHVKRRVESHETVMVGVMKSISELKSMRGPASPGDEDQ